jgi:thiol-disulfide isomerase/thioredoxin
MTPSDRKQIEAWLAGRYGSIELELIADDSEPAGTLIQFCEQLADISPNIKIKKRSPDSDAELPAIRVGSRLAYQAVPLGPELTPFLEALTRLTNPGADPATAVNALDGLTIPAHLQVYIAPQCPHCPRTVAELLPLIQANGNVSISVIDGTLFTEMAASARIKAVPTVILDTDFRWTGSVDMAELTGTIINRDPVKLGPRTLRSFIDDGRASDLAQMMITAKTVFPALIELITHDLWSVRLGAMVAAEEIAWVDRALAGTMIPALERRFSEVGETVQGDILHVIGESGSPDNIPFLESIAGNSASEELREAARDAIDTINENVNS